jgi:hypothetical protein
LLRLLYHQFIKLMSGILDVSIFFLEIICCLGYVTFLTNTSSSELSWKPRLHNGQLSLLRAAAKNRLYISMAPSTPDSMLDF